jgi:hypothetical protein
MEPKAIDFLERAMLPSHTIVTFAKDQPQYRPLPAIVIAGPDGRVITRWVLTDAERAQIAAGADLYIQQLTFGHALQPMLPTVQFLDLCPMEA